MASSKTIAVLDVNELKDGQIKEVDFDSGKVLLSNIGGKIHATSAYCTHYGAPLAKGVLVSSGRITCPWHGACFNVCTGDIEDAPALAAIHSFKATVKDSKIYVTADPSLTTNQNKSRPPTNRSKGLSLSATDPGVVIVGGGAGGLATVIGLRESGYPGKITVLSAEPHAPIDRTKLSKALLTDASKLEWYSAQTLVETFDVNLRTSTTVTAVDVAGKKVFVGSEAVLYEYLVLGPGGIPRRLPVPGADSPNVYTLRSVDDAKRISDAIGRPSILPGKVANVLPGGKNLVIIGSSFIGMELVVAVKDRGLASISVIGMTKFPFEAVLGDKIGEGFRKFHEGNGVKFYGESKVTAIDEKSVSFESNEGKKTTIPADVVILAVGVGPATQFLKGSGIETQRDGGIIVDEYLRVKGVEKVFAIGDVAIFKEPTTGEQARIEHWDVAQNHGRCAASVIAGKPLPFDKTPYFWSAQGQQLRYAGYGHGYDDIVIRGDPAALKFQAYYTKGDKVIAVSTMQADPLVSKASELFRLNKFPSVSEIRAGKDPLEIDISSSAVDVRH
ncbi:uncharacterized protein EI90DRAFT_2903794 [Cantharellus anzutake]|uniref:uncharacterized protein n=1 Tax=Cantharellus anzutake TaxID=1750568 RepID=UPI001908B3BE|nr:uncharacterized protein EI90DRAFT_2903794 [Cantharellus anzutake]KAF8342251.1 hypothetical protein EI90DRAFT_2903794 [Cantharellus anzutake]